MTDPDARLAELLGTAPPDGIAGLPQADLAELAELIAGARRQQADDLAAAFQATLRHVPFPVRGLARKMLFG